MIYNYICYRDYETGSRNPYKTQPTQLAAIMIDPRTLNIVENSLFESKIRPIWDEEECKKLDIEPVSDEALEKTHLTREELDVAPELKFVWNDYKNYLKKYNKKGEKGGAWDAPIVAGHNSSGFDDIIDIQVMEKYGPSVYDTGKWKIYYPSFTFDTHSLMHFITNGKKINSSNSMSMDNLRDTLGMDKTHAHRADFDVIQGAQLLIKLLKLQRKLLYGDFNIDIEFENCFNNENKLIRKYLNV